MTEVASTLDSTALVPIALAVLAYALSRVRAHLAFHAASIRVARRATADFYARADKILDDPATPDEVKELIGFLAEAVTRDQTGRLAMDKLAEVLGSTGPERLKSPGQFSLHVENLRTHRPDLYVEIFDALRAAMSAIILVHGHGHEAVSLEYKATNSQKTTEAVATAVAKAAANFCRPPDNGSAQPA